MLTCHDSNVILDILGITHDADSVHLKNGVISISDNQGEILTLSSAARWQDIEVTVNKVTRSAGDCTSDMSIDQCIRFKEALCGLFKLVPVEMEAPESITTVVRQLAALFECDIDSVTLFGYVFARLNGETQFTIDFDGKSIEFATVGNVVDGVIADYDEIRIGNNNEYVETFDELVEKLDELVKEL